MKDYAEKLVSFHQVSPTFFIGLGGSGSDVVDRIAEKLRSRWNWHTLDELVHFFAFDTNTHDLSRMEHIPRDNRVLISDFDKRAYVEQKRGRGYQDEDPSVTSWVHDWYGFRGTRGAGAGQIRLESRLALYYQLEQDRGRIIQRLNAAMNAARHHDNPYRRNEPPHFNVFVYGSIAGGTGSGSFLPVAYLLKELIAAQGWIPKIYGTLIMPSLFLNEVPGALHQDINANGYAALKELEHLMKLGAEGGIRDEEFCYNPNNAHRPEVGEKPYDFVYLADKPMAFEIDAYKNAIADAAYLLLYSPILGAQASDYDNYEKHQKGLVSGYTVYYGSNGCAVLLLPDQDILSYCALRYAAKAMSDYLLFQRDEAGEGAEAFTIRFDDPSFRRLSKAAQADALDQKFVAFVEYMARREEDDELEGGPYQAVASLRTSTGGALPTEFDSLLEGFTREIAEGIELRSLTSTDIVEGNLKIDAEINDLRGAINRSRATSRAVWDAARQDIKSGKLIGDFFGKHGANPYAQRLFLIRMKEQLRAEIDRLDAQIDAIQAEVDLDAESVTGKVKELRERLSETAQWTLTEKLKRKNEDFDYTRSAFLEYFNATLLEGNRALLINGFKRDWMREALEHLEKRLESFRSVALQAAEAIAAISKEAEEARQTGRFAHGDGDSNAYILDVEALQEIGGERLWDLFFEDRFTAEGRDLSYFDEAAIFEVITDAFNPRLDERGRRVARSAREITDTIRDGLVALGRERLAPDIVGTRSGGSDLADKGLLLDDALFYEARYHFLRQFRADNSDQQPSREQLQDYLKTKLRFCDSKAQPLATFTTVDDPRVIHSRSALVGCHGAYRDRIEPLLDEVLPDAQRIPKWHDEKAIVFYRANLGIPLYFYSRINGEMKRDYDRLQSQPPAERGYPLHIEARWEDGLPGLDPNASKQAERASAADEARIDFGVGFAAGVFRADADGAIYWSVGTFDDLLGSDRVEAFDGLARLDDRTRRRIEARIAEARQAIAGGADPNAAAQLDDYLDQLDEAIWSLEQRRDPSEAALLEFLKAEEATLKAWKASLGPR